MVLQNYTDSSSTETGYINSATIQFLSQASGGANTSSQPIINSALTSPFSMTDTLILNEPSSGPDIGEVYLFTTVPEPSALVLAGLGLAGLLAIRRRRS
jgi:hypothetical protein